MLICLAQEKKQSETQGFNELVQGVLTFSMREAYSDMPDEPPEGEGSGGQVSSQDVAEHATMLLGQTLRRGVVDFQG